MKSNAPKQYRADQLAKKISSLNKSQDEERHGRKIKRHLHDFRDISAQQLLTNNNAYDIA